jgi:acetoin utilization deacetylase AcuC-like enzyme
MKNDLIFFYPEGHEAHQEIGHPERPERVTAMVDALIESDWWHEFPKIGPDPVPPAVLDAIHKPGFIDYLERTCAFGHHIDMDTYTTKASWDLALRAAGGAIAVSRAIWQNDAQRGFALCRPPGHHATANQAMGFCLLNNIALAAESLIQGAGAQRIAIIDLDQHHGNGTQDIFWEREDVFYFSTHQYPHYPGTGRVNEIGVGAGQGKTVNFPLPAGSGDHAFQAIMDEAIIPILDRYMPEMILVSYGFDTHWRDPLGNLLLSAQGYYNLIANLTAWADKHCHGRIALILEGGYDLIAAKACAQGVTAALLGESWDDPLGDSGYAETDDWRGMLDQALRLWDLAP